MNSKIRTKSGTEDIVAHSVDEVSLPTLNFSKQRRKKKIFLYADDFACFDSETSHDNLDRGWIYQWALKLQTTYVYGRTPTEFIRLLEKMRDTYKLHDMKRLIIYVHNLSYDMQYLKHYLRAYDPNIEIFATDSHTMLIVDVFGFRFLCSWKLSNMSLDLFSRSYADHYLKAVGEIDYTKVRYQDNVLTADDWFYMFSDVASQSDAIEHYLLVNGYDKAYKAPFTSTGFVRVDSRKASEKDTNYRRRFARMALQLEQYKLLQQAFQGGLTIASFLYAGQTVTNEEKKIKHKDFNSSYPTQQMTKYFPIGKPTWYGDVENIAELNLLLNTYCCCFVLSLDNVHIRDGVTAPCIPASKCLHLENDLRVNGKIVYADTLSIAVTELDFKWIKRQYTGENMKIDSMLIMRRGEIPKWLKDRIMFYYHNKCTLKKSDPRLYQCSKGLLNGIYGMSATRIIRDSYKANEDMILEPAHEETDLQQLEKFYQSYNSFMPYQFGVWTTAHARDALLTMVEAVGYENFLYCDTDSVFYLSDQQTERRIMELNTEIKERALKFGAYDGENILGFATDEPEIKRFRALHAKCYAMEEITDSGTQLKVTIAGIPKKTTKFINGEKVTITNAEELGDIDELQDGFIFSHNGGTRSIYIEDEARTENINGHATELASACLIENIEKEINDTMWTRSGDFELLHIQQTSLV